MKFLIINGPNLNMLGIREPAIYGRETYADLVEKIEAVCGELSIECHIFQSNHEGDIVDMIQAAYGNTDGIVINAGAYTHTSVAILDALKSVGIPTAEVHISDPEKREEFRHISYITPVAVVKVVGMGTDGYTVAIKQLKEYIEKH